MELFGYWECAKYGEDPEVYRKVRKGNAATIVLPQRAWKAQREYRPPTRGEPQITQMAFGLNAGFDSEEPLILLRQSATRRRVNTDKR